MRKIPTVKEYEAAITRLSNRQIEILQTIYYFPNSAATAKELAKEMFYRGFQGANRQIGAIGQAIYEHTGFEPPIYANDNGRLAYFYLVGEYNGPGWKLWPEVKKALENLGLVEEKITNGTYAGRLPTEVQPFDEKRLYIEGKVAEVFVNRYERNRKARTACIRHYGVTCQGCNFDFGKHYGTIAEGFIQVHHLVPLAEIGKTYQLDPKKDLIPLCANCHSVVHMASPTLTIAELRTLIRKNKKTK